MVCRDFILPEPASYVFFYAIFNLRKLLYITPRHLGYAEPRHPQKPQPQSIQPEKGTETDGVPILRVFLHKNAPVNDRGILYLAVVTAYFMKVPSIICCR